MNIKPIFNSRKLEITQMNDGIQTENIVDTMVFDMSEFSGYNLSVLFADRNKGIITEVSLTTPFIYNIPELITKNQIVYFQVICQKDDPIVLNSSIIWKSDIYKLYFKNKITYDPTKVL